MQKIIGARFGAVFLVIASFLLFAGCGKPSHRSAMPQEPDRQTQDQILRKARADYEQDRDTEVIKELNRFLSLYSASPREREARWLLAKSYQRSGKLRSALKQYQIISKGLAPGREQKEVAERIDEINQTLKKVGTQRDPSKVVRTSVSQWYLLRNDRSIREELKKEGITSVQINLPCPANNGQQSGPVVKTSDVSSQGQLPSLVSWIQEQGLPVILGINLRCLGYLHSTFNEQWLDGAYNVGSGKVQRSPYFDIFHPQYEKLMAFEIKKFIDSGIDGVIFLAEVPLGRYDGFTPASVDMFNKTFRTQMNPHTLFENGVRKRYSEFSSEESQYVRVAASEESEFWRWIGWKARQRLTVMQSLIDQAHEYRPELPFGLELHPESVEDPLVALTQYSEDFLEAKQKSFTFFLITPQSSRRIQSGKIPHSTPDLEEFFSQSEKLVDRMTLVIQNPSQIWLSMPCCKRPSQIPESDSFKTKHLQKVSQVYDMQTFLDK